MPRQKREPKKPSKASKDIEERIQKNYFTNFEINQEFELTDTHKSFIELALNKKTKLKNKRLNFNNFLFIVFFYFYNTT